MPRRCAALRCPAGEPRETRASRAEDPRGGGHPEAAGRGHRESEEARRGARARQGDDGAPRQRVPDVPGGCRLGIPGVTDRR